MTEIKIDKDTLPAEGRKLRFSKGPGHMDIGVFVLHDQLFWVNSQRFYSAWDVHFWEYIDENK
jgi:hypothetical protein